MFFIQNFILLAFRSLGLREKRESYKKTGEKKEGDWLSKFNQ
jgi:hypothetical protein